MIKLNFKHDATVFRNELGELVENLAMLIDGHDVQILRFDGDDDNLLVKVDRSINRLKMCNVDAFIIARLTGG